MGKKKNDTVLHLELEPPEPPAEVRSVHRADCVLPSAARRPPCRRWAAKMLPAYLAPRRHVVTTRVVTVMAGRAASLARTKSAACVLKSGVLNTCRAGGSGSRSGARQCEPALAVF